MYDDDEELDEGRMTGLMNATVINDDDDDEFLDVSALNP